MSVLYERPTTKGVDLGVLTTFVMINTLGEGWTNLFLVFMLLFLPWTLIHASLLQFKVDTLF